MARKPSPLLFYREFALVTPFGGTSILHSIESACWEPAAPLPYVDVRAWKHYRGTFAQMPPMESAWTIEVVALSASAVHELMDAALPALRADIDAYRIDEGAHPGQPPERDPFGRAAEALEAWRREMVERLIQPPQRRPWFRRLRTPHATAG